LTCFKSKYPEFHKYIDMVDYSNNRGFRLPYQTNDDKPYAHNIIDGDKTDFIVNYIPNGSEILPLIDLSNNNIKTEISKNKYIEDLLKCVSIN